MAARFVFALALVGTVAGNAAPISEERVRALIHEEIEHVLHEERDHSGFGRMSSRCNSWSAECSSVFEKCAYVPSFLVTQVSQTM